MLAAKPRSGQCVIHKDILTTRFDVRLVKSNLEIVDMPVDIEDVIGKSGLGVTTL